MGLRIEVTKIEDIKIGYWFTNCCHQDLEELKTQSDIDQAFEFRKDELEQLEIWKTKLAALADIQYDFISSRIVSNNFNKDITELQGMILEEINKPFPLISDIKV